MKREYHNLIGSVIAGIGTILFLSSENGITGNVIGENLNFLGNIFGLVLIIVGLVVMALAPGLEQRTLSSGEREQIKNAFRNWDGRVNGSQKKILKRYGLQHEMTKGDHVAFYFPYASKKVYASLSPSDYRTGLNFTLKELIPYIEQNYQR